MNFLTNAIKYTEKGSVELEFAAENKEEDFVLRISVKDTGIGLTEDFIEFLPEEKIADSNGVEKPEGKKKEAKQEEKEDIGYIEENHGKAMALLDTLSDVVKIVMK